MTIPTILYFIFILLTCALTGFLAWYAWRQPHVTGARSYAYMALAESLLALTEVGSMLAGTEAQTLFWFSLRVPFAAFISVFWLFFAMEYNGRGDWLTKPVRAALFAVPLITQAVMVTGSLHGLWLVRDVGFEKIGPFWIADTSVRIPGFWYLVHTFYSTLLLVAGAGVLVAAAWRKPKILLAQALLVSLGALTALWLALSAVFNLLPELHFNPFVPGIGFSALCYALAIFRFQFLKHTPTQAGVARLTSLEPQEKRSLAIFIFLFILIASGFAAISTLTYQNYEKQFRSQVDNQLGAIASLKADELQDWRNERLADAHLFYRNENFSERVWDYLENPGDAEAQAKLLTWMEKIAASPEYDRVFLLDPQGVERLSLPADPEAVPAELVRQASASLASGQVVFLDSHRHAESDAVHLSMLVPIYDAQDNQPLGALVLRIDPNVYLYPFIQRWPVPSGSGETLLVRREGEEAVFLNSLRFQPDAALNLRFALNETELPAVKAVLGQEGIVEGLDYRGVEVIADMRAVPNSPWFMVSKIDTAEVYAPLRARLWQTILFLGALILASGAGLMLVWRQQRVRHYRAQIEAAESLRASEEKFRLAFETSPDSVAITRARDGLFVSVNKGFEQITGYKREEVIGRTSLEINIWKDPEDRRKIVEGLQARGEVRNYEAPFLTRDGEIIGMMSAAIIQLEGEPHILNITRDITERKQVEEALRESEKLLREIAANYPHSYISIIEKDLTIGFTSGQEFTKLGQDPAQFVGLTLDQVFGEYAPLVRENYLRTFDGVETQFELFINNQYQLYRTAPLTGRDGRIERILAVVENITERKQAEQESKRWADTFENVAFGFVVGSPDSKALGLMNPAFARMHGYTSKELTGAPIASVFAPERRADLPDHIRLAHEKGHHAWESKHIRKDGTIFPVLIDAVAVKDQDGKVLYRIVSVQDISERKRAEDQLRESEEKFRAFAENTDIQIIMSTLPDGKVLYVNPSFEARYLYTNSELVGSKTPDLYYDLEERKQIVRELQTKGFINSFEMKGKRKDGSWFWNSLTSRVIEFDGQKVAFTAAVDITERKQAEELLQKSEARYQALFDNMTEGFYQAELIEDELGRGVDFRFIDVNPAHSRIIGMARESVIGKKASELFPGLEQTWFEAITEVVHTGNPITVEGYVEATGRYYSNSYFSPAPGQFASIFLDITDRKQAEADLKESERRFRDMMEQVQLVSAMLDVRANITFANDFLLQLTGWKREEIIGRNWFDVFVPEQAAVRQDLFRDLSAGVAPVHYENEILTRTGERRLIAWNNTVLHHSNGAIAGIAGIGVDITERKQAEKKLRESEFRYRELFENINSGVAVYEVVDDGRDFIFKDFNRAGERIDRDDRARLIGRSISEARPGIEEFGLLDVFRQVWQTGQPIHHPVRQYKDERLTGWYENYVYKISPTEIVAVFEDVTERRQAEEKLKESEAKFRAVFDNAPIGISLLGPKRNVLESNETLERIIRINKVGLAAGAYRNRKYIREDGSDIPTSELASARAIVENRPVRDIVNGIVLENGEILWMQVSAAPLGPSETGVVVITQDITDRRRAEEELRKLSLSVEQSPASIVVTDPEGNIEYVNPRFCQITGYTAEEAIAKNPRILKSGETSPEEYKRLWDTITAGGEWQGIFHNKKKNGELYWESAVISPIVNPQGVITHFLAVKEDITERRQAEEALRASEERFRTLVEQATIAIFVQTHGQFAYANRAALRLFGADADSQLLGQPVLDRFHPSYREGVMERIHQLNDQRREVPLLEEVILRLDGGAVPVEVSAAPMLYREEHGAVVFILDITERKQAEKAMQDYSARLETDVQERTRELRDAQEKLVRQERLAVLGQLAGSIAHELRNPLGVISNAAIFLKMVQPDADAKIKEYLDIIESETHTSEKIITDLLDFARIKSINREAVSVPDLVHLTLKRYPPPPSVQAALELDETLPPVYVDPRHIIQVLGNLTVNACQAMPDGGKLTLSASLEGDMIKLAVQDTGIGISSENMSKIFEPLFTTKTKGIGLGLAVSRKMTEANGGRIEAQSEFGKGSTFTVYLPISKERV